MKILLLEDNKTLNETIKLNLEQKGYKVYSYENGETALENITEGFSCFILDINVPNVDGINILKKIRKIYKEVPVIIISSSIELSAIKKSYNFGCNEFIKKPFFMYELAIKIEKLCKIPLDIVMFDESSYFDFNNKKLSIKENDIILTQKENLMINLFLYNKNKIVTYENIQDYVYEGNYCSFDAIRTLIKRLRKKLNNKYITTSSNKGYIFSTNINL